MAHDLKLFPSCSACSTRCPPRHRVGPLIIDEAAGRPYAEFSLAASGALSPSAAGIPDDVWNMDARAGGITEAEDAGADLDHTRSTAAHSQISTTPALLARSGREVAEGGAARAGAPRREERGLNRP